MRLKDLCADEMPREKMIEKGAGALSNTELLAILLRVGRSGVNVIDVARELLRSGDGTLSSIAEMSVDKLCEVGGVGPGKAVAVAAAFELADFGDRTGIIRSTVYEGLYAVGNAVLNGTFHRLTEREERNPTRKAGS